MVLCTKYFVRSIEDFTHLDALLKSTTAGGEEDERLNNGAELMSCCARASRSRHMTLYWMH
eukprot:COSAG06_NODE_4263_length_4421_cov_38.991208_4_plen_61_part_00